MTRRRTRGAFSGKLREYPGSRRPVLGTPRREMHPSLADAPGAACDAAPPAALRGTVVGVLAGAPAPRRGQPQAIEAYGGDGLAAPHDALLRAVAGRPGPLPGGA